jgi:hypothetical protein
VRRRRWVAGCCHVIHTSHASPAVVKHVHLLAYDTAIARRVHQCGHIARWWERNVARAKDIGG